MLILFLVPLLAVAQSQIAPQEMEAKLERMEAAAEQDPDAARASEVYRTVVANLQSAESNRELLARQEQEWREAATRAAAAASELKNLQRQARSAQSMAQGVALSRLERLLGETRERLQQLRDREDMLQRSVLDMAGASERARAELKSIADTALAPRPVPRKGERDLLSEMRLDDWRARQELRDSRVAMLESDIRTLPERQQAAQAELKLVTAQREQSERFLAELLEIDVLKRIREAEQLRERIGERIDKTTSRHARILSLGQELSVLADEYVKLVGNSEATAAELLRAESAGQELEESFRSISEQLRIASLNNALGPVLMEHYLKLADFETPDRKLQQIGESLAATRLRQFQVDELLDNELQTRERLYRAVEATTELDGVEWPAAERRAAVAEGEKLLSDRATLLEALNASLLRVADQLLELNNAYEEQAQTAESFRAMLDRNLIWMASHRGLSAADLWAWPVDAWRMLAAGKWPALAQSARTQAAAQPLASGMLVLLCLGLAAGRGRLLRLLSDHSLRSAGWPHYRFRYALQSIAIHLLRALPLPLLLLAMGWVAGHMEQGREFGHALAGACRASAPLAYGYMLLLLAHRPEGFARQHLRWKRARVQQVAAGLRIALALLLPLHLFTGLAERVAATGVEQSWRLNGMLLALLFFGFALGIARLGGGMFDRAFFARPYPLLARAVRLLLVLTLAIQPMIVFLDWFGYHFTATMLARSTLLTMLLLLLARMAIDVGLLGITLAARRSLAAQMMQAERSEAGDGGAAAGAMAIGENMDLKSMNASAVVLLHVAVAVLACLVLLSVWRPFFTALGMLDEVTLWHYQAIVDGQDTQATVSLFDLGSALLVLALSLVLAQGLPSLIGIVFYGFITQKGLLFAIQTVLGYALAAIGVFVSLQMLGFGWAKLQWLAAGLSVGLGFGLQEIFANFISGLIMLFERPVRIGDLITLGEHSGTVQRIRIRATTITDFDNREVIVPNRMFVTERLVNWTLSSTMVRENFEVGISYDADPRLAQQLLQEVLEADPRILREPAPMVVFREFGASSLNLRCFYHIDDFANRNPVRNDLHMRITELFRERGIVIAYPQLDVHFHRAAAQPDAAS